MMWYLRTCELSSPSVFSEMGGMHYAPDNVADALVSRYTDDVLWSVWFSYSPDFAIQLIMNCLVSIKELLFCMTDILHGMIYLLRNFTQSMSCFG